MNGVIVTFLLCAAMQPQLKVADGPPRYFGDSVAKRVIQIEGEGGYDLEWQTRILRGIIERDQTNVSAPGSVEIELKLPSVRARIDLVHEMQLKDGDNVLASKRVTTPIFPRDTLSQFAATQNKLPELGLCDPAGMIAPVFEEAGLKFRLLQRDFQVAKLESKLVVVAPDQSLNLAEPAQGLQALLEEGGTVIFLARSKLPVWFYSKEQPLTVLPGVYAGAEPVVGGVHPIARDILPGDLHNWAGTGRVASNALRPSDWSWQRPILVSSAKAKRQPLMVEYWGENGRAIVCQLDIAARLRDEPVAQILLRNLISYARETPVPTPAHVMRIGIPRNALANGRFWTSRFVADPPDEQLEDLAALLFVVIPKGPQTPTHICDLRTSLENRGQIIIQSAFDDDVIQAVNDLVRVTWPEDPRAPFIEEEQLPTLVTRTIDDTSDLQMDYGKQVSWGVLPEDIKEGLNGIDTMRCIDIERKVKGWHVLARPGFLTYYKRNGSQLVLCSVPPRAEETNPAQRRVIQQIVANLGDFILEEGR